MWNTSRDVWWLANAGVKTGLCDHTPSDPRWAWLVRQQQAALFMPPDGLPTEHLLHSMSLDEMRTVVEAFRQRR